MKTIVGKNGTKYGLALGPAILTALRGATKTLLPAASQRRLMEYMVEHGIEQKYPPSMIIWRQEILPKILTDEEFADYLKKENAQELDSVKKCLRTLNGERFGQNLPTVIEYLEEEMSADDYRLIIEAINDAILSFEEEVTSSGESKPTSNPRGTKPGLASPPSSS